MKNKKTNFFKKNSLKVYLIVMLLSCSSWAQDQAISGIVTDGETNEPILGVNVIVKGTTRGTVTDYNGKFSLILEEADGVLQFSYLGMKSKEVEILGKTSFSIEMEPDNQALDEVVIEIGYGSSKVKDLTAPIVTIDAQEITKIASTSAVSALQGLVPGVQVVDVGAPGGTPSLRIRGMGSMQGAAPLYVVDGMFFDNITWLSPGDIKEMSVLKDASAAAIYGVRAAGGVILITTKSGRRNEGITVEYNGYTGVQTTTNILEMSNGREYSTMMIEAGLSGALQGSIDAFGAAPDKITWQGTEYSYPALDVDYYDELMKNSLIMNHDLSVRGGSEKADYRVSASYFSAGGRLINDHQYERVNISNKINFQPYKFLKLGSNFIVVNDITKNSASVWSQMYNQVPILPLWEENGDYGQRSIYGYGTGVSNSNPIVALDQADKYGNFNKNSRIMYSAYAEIDFLGNNRLKWRTQFTQDKNTGTGRNYAPQYQSGVDWFRLESILNKSTSEFNNIQIDNTLTYKNNFGNHSVSLMAGTSSRKVDTRFLSGSAQGVPWGDNGREEFLYLSNGNTDSQIAFDGGSSERGLSYISRLMYNYGGKYLLNATFRADGTDKYSEKWGYFPSIGVGWVLSEESFMKNQSFLDYAKIRASWGQLGNNNVPRESGSQSISFGGGVFDTSYLFDGVVEQGYLASIDFNTLKWEVTTGLNVGLDTSFFNDKLSVEADWYRKVTSDAAILTNGLMGPGVTPSLLRNAGEILNTGFEVTVGWQDKVGDLGYRFSANVTTLRNEVLKINDEYISNGSFSRQIRSAVGQPLYSFYGKQVVGIYQNQQEIDEHLSTTPDVAKPVPGYFKYEDVDGNGTIDELDNKYLGANIPKFTYGGTIALDYKRWDFSARFSGVAGNKIQNGGFNLRSVRNLHIDQNFDKALYDNRWTGEGTSNYYPSAQALTTGNSWNFFTLNSFLIESGSYFKVNNITLGYTIKNVIPGSINGNNIRLKLAVDNPFTFFKYNGFDPNVGGLGQDDNTYPLASNFIFGVTITY